MKKAEDYIIERETDHWADQEYCKSDIINWIKQAQIDAIEETVKKCAENATIDFIDLTSDKIFDYSDYIEGNLVPIETYYLNNYANKITIAQFFFSNTIHRQTGNRFHNISQHA